MKIIALEGFDGVGKTTLYNVLKLLYKDDNRISFLSYREFCNPLDDWVEDDYMDAHKEYAQAIKEFRDKGAVKVLILDRYIASQYAYNRKNEENFFEKLKNINKKLDRQEADLYVYLYKEKNEYYNRRFLYEGCELTSDEFEILVNKKYEEYFKNSYITQQTERIRCRQKGAFKINMQALEATQIYIYNILNSL